MQKNIWKEDSRKNSFCWIKMLLPHRVCLFIPHDTQFNGYPVSARHHVPYMTRIRLSYEIN